MCLDMCLDVSGHVFGHVSGHVSDHLSGHVSGHVSGYVSGHVSGHLSGHLSGQTLCYKYAHLCKYVSMKVCKYGRGYVVPEQRGRLIGKGPLPKEKFMKALGEVSSHCEIFYIGIWTLHV